MAKTDSQSFPCIGTVGVFQSLLGFSDIVKPEEVISVEVYLSIPFRVLRGEKPTPSA